jgi:hypothetical protein
MATLNCKTCGMIHPVCDPCEGPRKQRTCVTHHHACDCREREFEKIREQRDELLAACEKMVEAFEYSGTRLVGSEYEARETMKAAIKKAKGVQ